MTCNRRPSVHNKELATAACVNRTTLIRGFLNSACYLLAIKFCMKFYEYILNSFKVIERTRLCQETATSKVQRDVTQKVSIPQINTRVMVPALCTSPNVG